MPDLLVGAMICAVAFGLGFLAGSAYRAGVATYPQDRKTFSDLIAAADAGLSHAKENGRNRVSTSRPVELLPE